MLKNISPITHHSGEAPLPGGLPVANYDGALVAWDNRSVRSENVGFGQTTYRPGGYCGPRIQRDFELVLLHSGEGSVTVDGERRSLGIGAVALFLPNHREHFQFSRERETHHSWCSVSRAVMPRAMALELAGAPASVQCSEFFSRLFSSALIFECARNAHSPSVIERLGVLLFAEYLHLSEASRQRNHRTDPVNRALVYFENHFHEEGCLLEACRASGVSMNALIRHFAHELRTTPGRHLWKLRTEKGIAMLAKTGLTVAEIAYQCGFKTPFHFSRLVKKHHGVSPRETRARAWAV